LESDKAAAGINYEREIVALKWRSKRCQRVMIVEEGGTMERVRPGSARPGLRAHDSGE
jgi:hypothetical protein